MCEKLNAHSEPVDAQKDAETSNENGVSMTNTNSCLPSVILPILKVKLISEHRDFEVNAILDTGSQRSYILKDIASKMNYTPIRKETLIHSLFGGVDTEKRKHNCYDIKVGNLKGSFVCSMEVLDQDVICGNLKPVKEGPWLQELNELNICLTETSSVPKTIHVLFGSDVYGKLITGRHRALSSGPVAIETRLGWTLLGKIPQKDRNSNMAMIAISLFIKNAEISDLWNLDLIGIRDPVERVSKLEQESLAKEHFLKTVKFVNGRYEVELPWLDNSCELPDNYELASKRLTKTTEKLKAEKLYEAYDNIFTQWLIEGIIEDVPVEEINVAGNYLPHRPVIKESKTTPIRPVFDASAKMKNQPSLNQCLQCGPNLIENIPELLIKFRKKEIGVIADIKKAFLQVGVCAHDRNHLRFLWWKNKDCKEHRVFRHTRVVFGVRSSPFLLEAVLEYHIKNNMATYPFSTRFLTKGFYVDNLVTSLYSKETAEKFKSEANELMLKGGFELRGWEESFSEEGLSEEKEHEDTSVLGLIWNSQSDVLGINMKWLDQMNTDNITKRIMLATAHKIFDPMGLASPVTLCPKLMLRDTWKLGLRWDEKVPENISKQFTSWTQELSTLKEIAVPRWIKFPEDNLEACSFHTFVDASKDAYATVTYLRVEEDEMVDVFLLGSKSRVAPIKVVTIPRMELLAAVIGARLAKTITDSLNCEEIRHYFWSDSTTVLSWITREDNWSIFIKNRVNEIRKLTSVSSWGYVAGDENPADLPSRGCKANLLVKLRWWEGPQWMRNNLEEWPCSTIDFIQVNQKEVEAERKKSQSLLNNITVPSDKSWLSNYFSKYEQIVRLVAWIYRFKHNCLISKELRLKGELNANEYRVAENYIIKSIQEEYFSSHAEKLKAIETYKDENDVIRVKTKIVHRQDHVSFLNPAILPSDHKIVKRLIIHEHVKNYHAGSHILLNLLREKYWILNGRKTIRGIISKCVICKRFSSKNSETAPTPLPRCRVQDAAVFQTTGIDIAGPLFLKGNHKNWIVIFTCAVYRAVHLELVTTASTESFLMALRRFIARRGRISTIYTDNGSNFIGAYNQLRQIDEKRFQQFASVHSFEWKFNPPAAPWWGGWWERLIRIIKDLLRKVLGRTSLSYEEMLTVLIDCESIVNSRPLTYFSEDDTLKPLTPSMFLNDIRESNVPDIDLLDYKSLVKRIKYRYALQRDLRNRFRSEYLGQLVQKPKSRVKDSIKIGDIVLVGSDNTKRINWPLGKIIDVLPGNDHEIRVVKVKTAHSTFLRPIQRIYPLEIPPSELTDDPCTTESRDRGDSSVKIKSTDTVSKATVTRSGRVVKMPDKLDL